jgi:hypothetical protein
MSSRPMSFHLQLWHIDLIGDSHVGIHPRHGANDTLRVKRLFNHAWHMINESYKFELTQKCGYIQTILSLHLSSIILMLIFHSKYQTLQIEVAKGL